MLPRPYAHVVCVPYIEPDALAAGLAFYCGWLLDGYSGRHAHSSPDYLLFAQDMPGGTSAWLLGGRERLLDALLDCWRCERERETA